MDKNPQLKTVTLNTKFNSKWIKDLNLKPMTLNLIEEKVGSILECIETRDYFLNITPIVQTLRATINKLKPSDTEKLL